MEAWLEEMGVNQLKLQVKMDASEENIEAIDEPYRGVPHIKTIYLFTGTQEWASNVLYRVPEGVMYDETNGAPEE
jgi:hypothetical protein